jgi:hypothetical protein
MEIAILVFFLAIFGGALFLLALILFLVRRFKRLRSKNRNFSGSSSYITDDSQIRNDDYSAASAYVVSNEIYSDNSTVENRTSENYFPRETAHDISDQVGHAHSNHGDTHHADYSSSSYDSGAVSSYDSNSSYDSSSNSDSGSSASDSDSSSSSSD